MVVELKVMVYDGVIGMVELQEMFERSSSFVLRGLDIMNVNGFEINCCARVAAEEAGEGERVGEGGGE